MEKVFFMDGHDAQRHDVSLQFTGSSLSIRQGETELANWPLHDIRRMDAPTGILRLGLVGQDLYPARIETRNTDIETAIRQNCPKLEAFQDSSVKTMKIVGWSIAAVVSVTLLVFVVIPHIAEKMTAYVPARFEKRLGDTVDGQIRFLFSSPKTCTSEAGQKALLRLSGQLTQGHSFALQPRISVLSSTIENAFALPGGQVYIFSGLLNKAESADELAGVIAHEYGHVYNRDGLRIFMQNSGISLLAGLFFGDITGGSTASILTQSLISNSYSRDVERQADAFSAETMLALGRDPAAMAHLLSRIGKSEARLSFLETLDFLSTHPATGERLATLSNKGEAKTDSAPLLTAAEWQALKDICKD